MDARRLNGCKGWLWWAVGAALLMGACVLGAADAFVRSGGKWMAAAYFRPSGSGGLWGFAAGAALVAGALSLAKGKAPRVAKWLFLAILLGTEAGATALGWQVARLGPYGFDHPSFMFRIWEFGKVFPGALGSYMPLWNGGIEHFVGVTSGAHGWGLLCWPLLQAWEPHVFYGAALLFWFVWAWPWAGVASLRAAGVGWCGALAGGAMLCGISGEFFRWMWHFGTVGAMTSAMAAVPVVALGYRVAVLRRGGAGAWLGLVACAVLMCLWSPGVFVGAGLAAGALWCWWADGRAKGRAAGRFWGWSGRDWRALGWTLAAVAAVLAVLARWWWTALVPCHNVIEYVGTATKLPPWPQVLGAGARTLWRELADGHPLAVFLGLAGLCAATPRQLRRWLLPTVLVLAALAGWSEEVKPLSQMGRMVIPLVLVLAVPAAALVERLFLEGAETASQGRAKALWTWLACGLVVAMAAAGGGVAWGQYANRDFAPQRHWAGNGVGPLVEWIRENVPESGRVAFAGKSVHAYGGGNTAYLPVLAGREMMGDDYYGFPPGTIAYTYPPPAYRGRKVEGWREWSRMYGITHWVAARAADVKAMRRAPALFKAVASFELPVPGTKGEPSPDKGYEVVVFEVIPAREAGFGNWSARVLGHPEARVVAEPSHIAVEFPDGAEVPESVVLRYNWREGLQADGGAIIAPAPMDENVTFIEARPAPGARRIDIRYRVHPSPIQPNFDGRFHH